MKKSCVFCESAGASARKLTVSGEQSVKSDIHLYAELVTGNMKLSSGSVAALRDGLSPPSSLFARRLQTWMRRASVSGLVTRSMISF